MHYINDEFTRRPSTGVLMTFKDAIRKRIDCKGYCIGLVVQCNTLCNHAHNRSQSRAKAMIWTTRPTQ